MRGLLWTTNRDVPECPRSNGSVSFCRLPDDGKLVQERFPVGRHPSCGSRSGLILWMRIRRKQLTSFDHLIFLVIEEPILTRLEAGNDRMPCPCRMLWRMLAWGTACFYGDGDAGWDGL